MLKELEERAQANEQLDLFSDLPAIAEVPEIEASLSDVLCEEISEIDVDALTPRQALELIYELKDKAKKAIN